jgi:D-alanyl-D-alanine dipeptidase
MRTPLWLLLCVPTILWAQSADDELVNVKELIPDIAIDLHYNTLDNFFQQKLYTTDECLLAHGAARALKRVQDSLRAMGLGVKIWDGYRPRAVQYLMWEIFPNAAYVADPRNGSVHNRGGAVDLTLIDLNTGQELEMPTPFDFFGPEAGHDYMNLPAQVIANRTLLRTMMETVGGFSSYSAEWWHYSYGPATAYPLLDFQMK